ncbi:MAG: hypothetical protein M3365_07495 [Gemmatimonadota bacterium]|nr:hypothetical protein [Gemmatimonadota bacterium]
MMKYSALTLLALSACVANPDDKKTTADTTTLSSSIVTVTPVNRGTHGLRERLYWLFSPDRKAVLVVADPISIEADALPNAFFFGDETRAFQVQMDSVWDVAVSPDWKWIGFGRAYTLLHGEAPATNEFAAVSRRTSIDTATLRTSMFPTSGMVTHFSIAQPGVIRLPEDPRRPASVDSAAPRLFPVARGWRVRWTSDGRTLALGNNPSGVGDDEPSKTWSALDPVTGSVHTSLPSNTQLSEPAFTKGPVLGDAPPVDMNASAPIKVERDGKSYTIESQRGVITLVEAGNAAAAPKVIGAGVALAATAGGRYVVALAPKTSTRPSDPAIEPVVYTVTW